MRFRSACMYKRQENLKVDHSIIWSQRFTDHNLWFTIFNHNYIYNHGGCTDDQLHCVYGTCLAQTIGPSVRWLFPSESSDLQHWYIAWSVQGSSPWWNRHQMVLRLLQASRCWQQHGGRVPSWSWEHHSWSTSTRKPFRGFRHGPRPATTTATCDHIPPCSGGYHTGENEAGYQHRVHL